jgi:hypothetical protein
VASIQCWTFPLAWNWAFSTVRPLILFNYKGHCWLIFGFIFSHGSQIIAVGLLLLLLQIALVQLGLKIDAMSAFMLVIVIATLSPKLLELNTERRNSEER